VSALPPAESIELDEKPLASADYITEQVAYLTPVNEDVKLNDLGLEELRAEILRLERGRSEEGTRN
jgi:hypothetical protein